MTDMSQPITMTDTQMADLKAVCNEYGLKLDEKYMTSDCGNVQLKFKQGGYDWSVTYDPNNPESYDNVFTYKFGTYDEAKGYYKPPKDEKSNYVGLADYYLNDTTHNHTAFIGSTGAVLPDGAQAAIMSVISGNDNQRLYVDSGSSAATYSLGDVAKSQVDSAKGILYMPVEPAGYNEDGKPGRLMAENIANNTSSVVDLQDKTIGLLALEGAGNTTTQAPENAVPFYSRIANDTGMPVYMMVDPAKTEHALKDSPEEYLANGFVDTVFDTLNGKNSASSGENDEEDNEGLVFISDSTTDSNLLFYQIEGREDWKNISLTTAGTAMITLSAAEFLAGLNTGSSDIDFVIDFNSVRENLSILRNGIGATNLEERRPYECVSNSSFPNSLNDGTSFLYGTSKDLMNKMSLDIRSVEKIASLLQETDENTLVNMLNETFGTENLLGANGEINGLAFDANANNRLPDIFSQTIKEGAVGRISMEDIDGILRGNTLIGSIGKGLEQEIEEANAIKDDINNLLATTNMSGPIWDKLQIRFNDYNNCCDARINASECLQEAYVNALNILRDYYYETADKLAGSNIYLGGALDDGQIPVCQATIEQLRADIENLNAEFDSCMAVPRMRGTGRIHVDANGREWEEMEPNEPEYTNAQLRAKEITYVIIPQKNEEIRYNNIYIDQLEGLAQKVNRANEVVTTAIDNIQASYTSMVSSIQPIIIADSLPTISA